MATEPGPAAILQTLARVANGVEDSAERLRRIEAICELTAQTQFRTETGIKLLVQAQRGTHDAIDRKSTRLNSSHIQKSRMPSSA